MIRRFRVRKKKTTEAWVICIQVLREPKEDDIKNLGFRRHAPIPDVSEELLQDDADGDTLIRDLEVDMLETGDEDEYDNKFDDIGRIPPQWTPDRLLGNIIFELTSIGKAPGWDAIFLRDRIMGPFWRRPMEAFLTRLTDDWERSQPAHLRCLAIIRDTRNTEEKKFLHYVYRTYGCFQQAVKAGEASWEAVSRPVKPGDSAKYNDRATQGKSLDAWGFRVPNQKDFLRFDGAATLSESRPVVKYRNVSERWDIILAEELGLRNPEVSLPTPMKVKHKRKKTLGTGSQDSVDQHDGDFVEGNNAEFMDSIPRPRPVKGNGLNLTPEQRISLGLKPSGRLSKPAAKQILAHRRRTGDPTSLPDAIVRQPTTPLKTPLMTKEERIALNLPPRGRLGLAKENEIREQRGLPKLVGKRSTKKRTSKDAAILTKQQRIALGFKDQGRLHQFFVDALRREHDHDIPLEESPAVEAYREFLKNGAQQGTESLYFTDPKAESGKTAFSSVTSQKRKASDAGVDDPFCKRQHVDSDPFAADSEGSVTPAPTLEETGNNDTSVEPGNNLSVEPDIVINDTPFPPNSEHVQSKALPPKQSTASVQPLEETKVDETETEDAPRVLQGAYVYLSAKRKIRRGRPKNACVAVFRLLSLAQLAWFKDEPNTRDGLLQITSMGPCKFFPTQSATRDGANANHDSSSGNIDTPSRLPGALQPETTEQPHPPIEPPPEDVSALMEDTVEVIDHTMQPVRPIDQEDAAIVKQTSAMEIQVQAESWSHQDRDVTGEIEETQVATELSARQTPDLVVGSTQIPTLAEPSAHQRPQTAETGEVIVEAESLTHQSPAIADTEEGSGTFMFTHGVSNNTTKKTLPTPRAARSAEAGDQTTQVEQPTYRSPYAPRSPIVSAEPLKRAPFSETSTTPPTRLENNMPTPESTIGMPEGIVRTIADVEQTETAALKKLGARSAGPAITGTALKFRREIILEIIDRCGGVFPLHGEIGRPFSALWDQKHGHTSIPKPLGSTVSDTLKSMIGDPTFKLKRMAFAVKARNATGSKERVIVTRLDMTPTHPRVMKLAYNMANNSLDKSHQYYPEEIRDIFEFETLYVPLAIAPKDDSITLDQMYPELLESSIKENQKRRRKEQTAQKKAEKEAARKQNEQVEQGIVKKQPRGRPKSAPRAQRTRLASLNDKNKRYRRANAHVPVLQAVEETSTQHEPREPSPTGTDSSEDVPLISLQPAVTSNRGSNTENVSRPDLEDNRRVSLAAAKAYALGFEIASLTHPTIRFHSATGTFATVFDLTEQSHAARRLPAQKSMSKSTGTKKRVRIDDSTLRIPNKRAKNGEALQRQILDAEFVHSSTDDSDATSSEDEDEETRPTPKQKQKQKQKKRQRAFHNRQLGKKLPAPTLLERLTGLTGDPNDPLYTDPKDRRQPARIRSWSENRKRRSKKSLDERNSGIEALDHVDRFKRLCLTLVVASSLSTEEGLVNWSIVEKVYARDSSFDKHRTMKLWEWVQINMDVQMTELKQTFQSTFLAAYEAERLPEIGNPETYDWAGLLRWAMRTCTYPELPLPLQSQAVRQFVVDESSYTKLDRTKWYREKIADSTRTQLQLQLPFVAPLHQLQERVVPSSDEDSKARSWIRANTATPQSMYDANQAHEKFKGLGETVLTRVVGDLVQREQLRMRKLKRQLPGRNYTFAKRLAKTYKRPFELEDFMEAAALKKTLDTCFANTDPEKRFYSISRSEEDGSVMAIMSLVGDGKVKLVPQLPAVHNEFGAPLPRLSKWGFCEGDYVHRAIDRERLFWNLHVAPTPKYEFGNPLQPTDSATPHWPSLPEPPMPGKDNKDAALPIWSNINGQSITWPWWYRILNLVLQPLFQQPGATAADVHSHCAEHAAAVFEVQLSLEWLESIGAVTKIADGGYQVTANFWAAFGDKLLDTEDDWFGEHVKRNSKLTSKQRWRDEYNLRYAAMRTPGAARAAVYSSGEGQADAPWPANDETMDQEIARDPNAQYRILQRALHQPGARVQGDAIGDQVNEAAINQTTTIESTTENALGDLQPQADATIVLEGEHIRNAPPTPQPDIEMRDAGADADEESQTANAGVAVQDPGTEDRAQDAVDAEGEDVDMDAEGDVDDMMS